MVLNTSFNEDEPIVRTPAEALRCFDETGIDCLIMEQQLVER
jgi:carbamoyltransferase